MTYWVRDKRVLFVHIPRTGGLWWHYSFKHLDIPGSLFGWNYRPRWVVKRHTLPGNFYRNCTRKVDLICTIVRHPISLYESWWKWINRAFETDKSSRRDSKIWNPDGVWNPAKHLLRLWSPDFNAWMTAVMEEQPAYFTRLFEWYAGPEGAEYCSYIARQETLQTDFYRLVTMLGYEKRLRGFDPAHVDTNKAHRGRFCGLGEVEWDPDVKKQMMHNERVAIDRFYGESTKDKRKYANMEHHEESWPKMTRLERKGMYYGKKPPWRFLDDKP
jgi:hypothetical protein